MTSLDGLGEFGALSRVGGFGSPFMSPPYQQGGMILGRPSDPSGFPLQTLGSPPNFQPSYPQNFRNPAVLPTIPSTTNYANQPPQFTAPNFSASSNPLVFPHNQRPFNTPIENPQSGYQFTSLPSNPLLMSEAASSHGRFPQAPNNRFDFSMPGSVMDSLGQSSGQNSGFHLGGDPPLCPPISVVTECLHSSRKGTTQMDGIIGANGYSFGS